MTTARSPFTIRAARSPSGLDGGGEGGRFGTHGRQGRPAGQGDGIFQHGATVEVVTPGSGGYGNPELRDPSSSGAIWPRQDLGENRTGCLCGMTGG
ncbi:MAG: hypothetical protein R3D03_11140 [Geminicoccaceae bacterium]